MDRLVHHAASAPRVYRSLAMDPQVLRRERVEVNRRSKRLPDQRRVVAGDRLVEPPPRPVLHLPWTCPPLAGSRFSHISHRSLDQVQVASGAGLVQPPGGRLVEGGEREVPPRLPRLDTLLREGGELAGLRLNRGPAAIPGRRRSLPVPRGRAFRARELPLLPERRHRSRLRL